MYLREPDPPVLDKCTYGPEYMSGNTSSPALWVRQAGRRETGRKVDREEEEGRETGRKVGRLTGRKRKGSR